MDVKDLRTGSALSERNNDGSKYSQGGGALACNRNKSYQDIGSTPLAKAEAQPVRPCAVIGPDRVLPPPATSTDAFIKKVTVEPWLSSENVYRRPPEYHVKPSINQNPTRNISPRQTFQENMQRIMVPPNYSAVKHGEDANYSSVQDRNLTISKSVKPNVAPEAKYSDVPYTINTLPIETKNMREAEMYVPSVNSPLTRTVPPVWPPASVNVHASRTFGAHDVYQYPQYQSCAGPRPPSVPVHRPPRVIPEESGYPYPDHYYQDARFKPYPVKERYPQARYISHYPPIGSFHPPSQIQPHKYDMSKPGQPHPYPVYPHLKYVENRIPDPSLEGYQRPSTQQPHYNIPFRNQVIHPTFAPVPGSIPQNKMHPYPPDISSKHVHPNKLPFETNKMYVDYENSRSKTYPMPDNYFVNEVSRLNPAKSQMIMQNYSRVAMPPGPMQHQYRKDNAHLRSYDYMTHYRTAEHPLNPTMMMHHPPQFSPSALAISPTDSIASNDTVQTHGTSQDDCGYISQSSSASVRSIDSGMYKQHNEFYKRYDYRYSPIVGSSPTFSNQKPMSSNDNKQKQIDVRQFLQMWNEGEDDNAEVTPKEIMVQTGPSDIKNMQKQQHATNQDQLYVLGLVNVPSEELSKYEHIQKISKLPENIKGYNNLELLSQFEEAIESSSSLPTSGSVKPISREYQALSKENLPKPFIEAFPTRPVSPLDVEAKISQSVIHKEVGCNFEIRPCSPKMLNVEVATPAQNVLGERLIEKVTNPLSKMSKSPTPINPDDNTKRSHVKGPEKPFIITDNPSCNMVGSPYDGGNIDSVKANYSLHDLEINSGICLASLPRLDNEIELNFPEVNQQFINATKKDSDSTPRPDPRDHLNEKPNLNSTLDGPDIVKSDMPLDESEKAFTKLSKYRKTKSNLDSVSDINCPPKIIRTDSVIIKNPENIKNIEDNFLEGNTTTVQPMNLSSQSLNDHQLNFEFSKTNSSDIDNVALDFSLNKPIQDALPIIDMNADESANSATLKPTDGDENNSHTKDDVPEKNQNPNELPKDINDVVAEINEITSVDNKEEIIKDVKVFKNGLINSEGNKNEIASLLNDVYSENDIPEKEIGGENETKSFEIESNFHAKEINRCNVEDVEISNNYQDEEIIHRANIQDEEIDGNNQNVELNRENILDEVINRDKIPDKVINIANIQDEEMNRDSIHDEEIANGGHICNFVDNVVMDKSENKQIVINNIMETKQNKIQDNLDMVLVSSSERLNQFKDTAENLHDEKVSLHLSFDETQTLDYCKNKDLMETDEISATLEKIFEGTEDVMKKDTVKQFEPTITNDEPINTPIKRVFNYQSKELHSPFIQKLLLFSDGQCSSSNHILLKESNKCSEITNVKDFEMHSNDINDTNKSLEDKGSETLVLHHQSTGSSLFDDIDKSQSVTDMSIVSTESELPHRINVLGTEGEKQSKCAKSLIQTNEMSEETTHLGKTDDAGCEPKMKIDGEKNNLNAKEITDVGISIFNTHQNTDNNNVKKESVNKCQEQNHNSALLSVECSIENPTFSVKQETTFTEGKYSLISENIELSESGVEYNKSEYLKTNLKEPHIDDGILKTEEDNKPAENIFDLEDENKYLELDKHVLAFTTSDLICKTNQNQKENTTDLFSCEMPDEGTKYPAVNNKENLNKDMSTINLPEIENDQETDSTYEKNRAEVDNILLLDNKKDVDAPFLNSENTAENVDYLLIREQGQTDDQVERTVPNTNDSEIFKHFSSKSKSSLKRSYSDSDLRRCKKSSVKDIEHNLFLPTKRQKLDELDCSEQSSVAGNLCSIIQNSRRNSVSAFYNEDVSFCILIDNNCIITEEDDDEKICFAEIDEDCITEIHTAEEDEEEPDIINSINETHEEVVSDAQENEQQFCNLVFENCAADKAIQENWLDDVACVETVVSDDITEEIIFTCDSSPKGMNTMYDIAEENSNSIVNESVDGISIVNGECVTESICEDEPYGMPHVTYEDSYMSSDDFEPGNVLYKDECLERIISESNSRDLPSPALDDTDFLPDDASPMIPEDKENIFVDNISLGNADCCIDDEPNSLLPHESNDNESLITETETSHNTNTTDHNIHSCESGVDNVFNYKTKDDDNVTYTTSSSPEVSSTTSEDKSSSLVLKITNYNGSRVSQINEVNHNKPRCKFTEKKEYSNLNGGLPKRPLLTKAAQKYIPPLKESISDLKVKLSLPQQKLLKLKQLKLSKKEPKTNRTNLYTVPKKPKPNFEDVLKNIDEVQIKMHKEKSKKPKPVPKVVIKKGHNGSHYTSTSNRDAFNPDLTGRKWQPWVFIEKNQFIDKMAIRNKTKAIFSHRQNTYVLAEKFKKYKSISSAKFVITHPNTVDSSKGQLKYTIRLKHTY